MLFTKEKLVALVSLLLAGFLILDLRGRIPAREAAPELPPPEDASPYRAVASTPVLSPEKTFTQGRDPFQVQDAWGEAPPALLALPPTPPWPRAVPGGLEASPRGPGDRLLLQRLPQGAGQ